MASCVCSCKAYGGACACRFDGRAAGLLEGFDDGREDTVKKICAWLRGHADNAEGLAAEDPIVAVKVWPEDTFRAIATEIEDGEWRK